VARPFPALLPLVAFAFALGACAHDAAPAIEAPARVTVERPDVGPRAARSEPISPTDAGRAMADSELPGGWPAAIPVIDGGNITSPRSSASGKTTTLSVTIESTQSTDELFTFYDAKITAAGYEAISKTEAKARGIVTKSVAYQKGKHGADGFVNLTVMPSFTSKDRNAAMISVTRMKE
jgi:hypothetical protein